MKKYPLSAADDHFIAQRVDGFEIEFITDKLNLEDKEILGLSVSKVSFKWSNFARTQLNIKFNDYCDKDTLRVLKKLFDLNIKIKIKLISPDDRISRIVLDGNFEINSLDFDLSHEDHSVNTINTEFYEKMEDYVCRQEKQQ